MKKCTKKGFSIFSTKDSLMLCFRFELEYPFPNSGVQSCCSDRLFVRNHKHLSLIGVGPANARLNVLPITSKNIMFHTCDREVPCVAAS